MLVTVALVFCRKVWSDIKPDAHMGISGFIVGILTLLLWIVIDSKTPHFAFLGKRVAFNPFEVIANPTNRALFLFTRFYGLSLMVPLMEELFWRSFLLRYVTKPEYQTLRVGEFSWGAFAIVAGLFGFVHPEWLAAIVFAAIIGLFLRRTQSLFACIVAHGVCNLGLGIYVIATGSWGLW